MATVSQNLDKIKQVANYDFGSLYKKYNIDIKGLDAKDINALQNYINLLGDGKTEAEAFAATMGDATQAAKAQTTNFNSLNLAYQEGKISQSQYATATQNLALTQKTATATSKALSIALNTLANIGIMVAINLAIKGISALVDKLVVTKEELAEIRDEAVSSAEELKANVETFVEEADAIDELVQKYKEIHLSVTDINESKEELLQIQTDLIDKFGGEASGIDLVNGKYEEQIDIIERLSQAKYDEWKRKNASAISRAQKVSEYNVGWYNPEINRDLEQKIMYAGSAERNGQTIFFKDDIDHADELAASLYKIKDVSEDIQDIYKNVSGVDFVDRAFSNDLLLSGTLEDARDQLGQIIDEYSKLDTQSSDTLKALEDHYKALNKEIEDTEFYMSKIRQYESAPADIVGDINTQNLDNLKSLISSMGEARAEWFKALDEMESGFGKSVDSMSSALQKLVDGKNLSSSEFWDLMELDTDKIITDIKMVGDEFVIDQQQLIQLKDQQIQKQIDSLRIENSTLETKKQTLSTTIEQAQAELSVIGARGMANSAYRQEYQEAVNTISQGKKNLQDYGDQIRRNNILIDQWRSKLGDTADYTAKTTQQIKELNDYADNLLKAQEHRIDQIIDGHQRELDSLNAEKEVLQDELDALNDQKDAIEDIIKNYESVNSIVQDTVQKEIDALNEQKKAIEDTYNKRIEALKTENEEREDALEYAQKLANLENAKNNKVRVIDATRGFRYESVKEDVAKAQSDLDSFENAQAIKALEKARDAETKVIDDVIEEKEKYSKSWADILDTIKTDEDELLAAEILGADWREKIAQGDTELMEKFRTEYLKHNANLKTLTNTEIKLKEAAIKAKDEEINAKNEQIKKWKEYKTEVQNAAKEIKDANDGYLSQLSTVELDETSSLERRQANLDAFKTAYTNALSTVVDLQNQLGGGDYYYTMHVENTDELEKAANDAAKLAAASAATYAMADEVKKRQVQNAGEEIAQVGEDIIKRISGLFGFSEGGVADYTGLAMLHGRKSAPETIFNANDSAKLYEMVHNTPNLMADMIDKATKISGFNLANASNNTQNSNEYSFYIDKIVTDNPQDFAKQLDRYYQTKLTESYTNK